MLLQLNTTCDACTRNCSQSTTVKSTIINALEDCLGPIYHVGNTISNHSKKLVKIVKNLQDAVDLSKSDDRIVNMQITNIEVNDLCLCDA